MKSTIVINQKYCGPTNSGNGGYVSGIIAKAANFPAQVTLRKPPPLGKPLSLITSNEKVELFDEAVLIGEAEPNELELEVPPPPSFEEAVEISKKYPGFGEHPFPNCFVCGTNRAPDDGLNLFPGFISEKVVASPWIPDPSLSDDGAFINSEFYWAAMDCPGAWTYLVPGRTIVLGRISAKILEKVRIGGKYVTTGWNIGEEGRKIYTGTAIFDEEKRLCSFAKATWIALK